MSKEMGNPVGRIEKIRGTKEGWVGGKVGDQEVGRCLIRARGENCC